jgi:hypothetical protein
LFTLSRRLAFIPLDSIRIYPLSSSDITPRVTPALHQKNNPFRTSLTLSETNTVNDHLFTTHHHRTPIVFDEVSINFSTTAIMSSNATFEWTLERLPDLRLATNIVENPRSLLATIFDTPLEDIPTTLASVATYDAVFDAAQHCIVSIEKALIDKAIEATRNMVETEEAKQRLLELALYDAQMAVMSIAGELLHHAYCHDDEPAAELLRAWAPDRVWKFLDLSAAIQAESATKGWTEAEFSPADAIPPPPNPQAVPKLMAVPLRTAISMPPRWVTTPYREKEWFRKRTSQAWSNGIFQRLERSRRALGEDPAAEAGDAEDPNAEDPDWGSESEPEPSGIADSLDPGPNFRRHPNA